MALKARVGAAISGVLTKALGHGENVEQQFRHGETMDFSDGAGANQANKVFASRRAIAAGANDDIDLSGALENDLGDAVVFAAVKAILLRHISGPNPITVGAGVNPLVGPWASTVELPVGGQLLTARDDAAGWPVTAGTADVLRLANPAGGAAEVDIIVIGI